MIGTEALDVRTDEVDVLGHLVRVQRCGEGPPILLLHGFFHSSEWWEPNLRDLHRDFSTVAVDLPGFGGSGRLKRPLTPAFVEEFGLALLEALGLERCAVIAHSMGGAIALRVAWARPSAVSRLVLVAPINVGREIAGRARLAGILPALSAGIFALAPRAAVISYVHRLLYDSARTDPDSAWANLVYRDLRRAGAAQDWARMLSQAVGMRWQRQEWIVDDRLRQIVAPTLILWGEDDPLLPARQAQALASRLPTAQAVILPRCGHRPQLEQLDAFNRTVREFLADLHEEEQA